MTKTSRVAVLVAALAVCSASARSEPVTNEQNQRTVRRLFEDSINRGKVELLSELISPDYAGPRGGKGPAAFGAVVNELRTAFPDIAYTIEDLFGQGDRVVVRWRWTGTHRGPFRNHAATGKAVTNTGIGIFELRGGQIVSSWLETDRLGFLQEIGALPRDL